MIAESLCRRPLALRADRLRGLLALSAEDVKAIAAFPREHAAPKRRAGVAVLPVTGPLFSRGDLLTRVLGFASYDELAQDLAALAAEPAVEAIVLDVDSPGGDVIGMFELAEKVAAVAEAKPVVVHAAACYSAAYALASGASRIVVPRAGGVGSVGVVAVHEDRSKAFEQAGLEVSLIHAGARKVDGNPFEPLSDPARADLQAEVDRLYGLFVEHVAAHRGLSPAAVRATEAGTFHGERAVAAGLADEVGGLDRAIELAASLADSPAPRAKPARAASRPADRYAALLADYEQRFGAPSTTEEAADEPLPNPYLAFIQRAESKTGRWFK